MEINEKKVTNLMESEIIKIHLSLYNIKIFEEEKNLIKLEKDFYNFNNFNPKKNDFEKIIIEKKSQLIQNNYLDNIFHTFFLDKNKFIPEDFLNLNKKIQNIILKVSLGRNYLKLNEIELINYFSTRIIKNPLKQILVIILTPFLKLKTKELFKNKSLIENIKSQTNLTRPYLIYYYYCLQSIEQKYKTKFFNTLKKINNYKKNYYINNRVFFYLTKCELFRNDFELGLKKNFIINYYEKKIKKNIKKSLYLFKKETDKKQIFICRLDTISKNFFKKRYFVTVPIKSIKFYIEKIKKEINHISILDDKDLNVENYCKSLSKNLKSLK